MAPADHAAADPEPPVTVTFRHWDPRVLGALMPALDAAQFARVLGPAEEIAFSTTSRGVVRRVIADAAWPPAPSGLLLVRSDQIEALTGRRQDASHRQIASYLRDVVPEKAAAMSDDDLLAFVEQARPSGVRLGLESEQAFGRWAYLMLATNGEVARVPEIPRYIVNGVHHPDRQLSFLIGHAAHAAMHRGISP